MLLFIGCQQAREIVNPKPKEQTPDYFEPYYHLYLSPTVKDVGVAAIELQQIYVNGGKYPPYFNWPNVNVPYTIMYSYDKYKVQPDSYIINTQLFWWKKDNTGGTNVDGTPVYYAAYRPDDNIYTTITILNGNMNEIFFEDTTNGNIGLSVNNVNYFYGENGVSNAKFLHILPAAIGKRYTLELKANHPVIGAVRMEVDITIIP